MNAFINSIHSELLKSKRSAAFWVTFLGAAFIPSVQFLICVLRPEIFLPKMEANPWFYFSLANWKPVATIILPLFVILVTNLLLQIEFRNNAWKQVYTTPVRYSTIFFSKLLVIQLFIFLFLVLFIILMVLAGFAIEATGLDYGFSFVTIPWLSFLKLLFMIYLSLLPVSLLQYGLSGKYKNFVVALAVGMLLWITGLVILEWEHIRVYPYIYSTLIFFYNTRGHTDQSLSLLRNAVIWAIFFLSISFWENYQRKQR